MYTDNPNRIRWLSVTAFRYASLSVLILLLPQIALAEIQILPSRIVLDASESRCLITTVKKSGDDLGARLDSESITYSVSNESVVVVRQNRVVAVGDGNAEITANTSDGEQASVSVTVRGTDAEHKWSFRNDVQSVLAKQGCNMGACHGALAGKGGFGLSLRGYDSDADYAAIVREARGRRIEMADPGRSLILAKPTGALPHKGGIRLDPQSRDYRVLAQWISSGAASPSDDDAALTHIEVLPDVAMLKPKDQSQILVQANYDDGRVVDVTHWAQFSATDESIASVDDEGLVSVRGSGESAVLVWFGSKVALARMTVPFENDVPESIYKVATVNNFIDQVNLKQLQTLDLEPSPPADEQTFLRRATIDTIGRLPSVDERAEYLEKPESERRDWLIEQLLGHEDFVDYWSYKWSDILVINGTRLRPVAVKTYYNWVHDSVSENKPWDEMVREILTATGRSDENGATNFYALNQSPEDMTENACQAFMGLSIGCAKCHNHPLEKWTNDQYYSMANLFARVRAKGWGGDGRNGDGIRTLYVSTSGDLIQPGRGTAQPPAPLDAQPLAFDDPSDRRAVLAEWMTSPDNPYFARSIANRIWANFFGRGLVEQIDDLRLSNPASNEEMLTAIADHVAEAKFDLKSLMRVILSSETYARSSVPLEANRSEGRYNSRYYPRRLMAEVLLDSIDQVLETTTNFDKVAFPGADKQDTDFYKDGTRAIELYDAAVDSYFLKTFGRNPREITCECERSGEPSMVQVLHLSNGETLNPKLSAKDNLITRLIDERLENDQIVTRLFVRSLSREPSEAELQSLLSIASEYGEDRRTAIQDVAWSILTSTEFVFNH